MIRSVGETPRNTQNRDRHGESEGERQDLSKPLSSRGYRGQPLRVQPETPTANPKEPPKRTRAINIQSKPDTQRIQVCQHSKGKNVTQKGPPLPAPSTPLPLSLLAPRSGPHFLSLSGPLYQPGRGLMDGFAGQTGREGGHGWQVWL